MRSRLRACHLFIGVDYDDRLWAESHRALAEAALERANVQFTVVKSPATQPAGAVCAVWDRLARAAVLLALVVLQQLPALATNELQSGRLALLQPVRNGLEKLRETPSSLSRGSARETATTLA